MYISIPTYIILGVNKALFEFFHAFGLVGNQQTLGNEFFHVGDGPTPDQIRLGIVLFGQHACTQFTGGKTDDVDFQVGHVSSGRLKVFDRFVRLQRRVNRYLFRGNRIDRQKHCHDTRDEKKSCSFHTFDLLIQLTISTFLSNSYTPSAKMMVSSEDKTLL